MSIQWDDIQKRYDALNERLVQGNLDSQERQKVQKEASHLQALLTKHREIDSITKSLTDTKAQLTQAQQTEPELAGLFKEEIIILENQLVKKEQELEDILYPANELDDRSVFLEIRAGAGGQEAALFAADLMRMYSNYGLQKNWHVSISDISETDLGGIREVILHIEGKGIYGHLKNEAGVHRVQRVPKTETAGRVHTSTITVAVLPEAEEVDMNINPVDLRVDTYRAGGAGGQHVNKTESAIRITHIPTGIVVACQEERSQHKNRAKAMKMLQSRILAAQREKQEAESGQKRKEMVGTGMRAEKVRTYNFPQNRITDHRIELTLKNLDMVMEGHLDPIIDELMKHERQERKKRALSLVI